MECHTNTKKEYTSEVLSHKFLSDPLEEDLIIGTNREELGPCKSWNGVSLSIIDLLVSLVRDHHGIYEKRKGPLSPSREAVEASWSLIVQQVNCAFPDFKCCVASLKNLWEALKAKYRRLMKFSTQLDKDDQHLFDILSFLEDYVNKPTQSYHRRVVPAPILPELKVKPLPMSSLMPAPAQTLLPASTGMQLFTVYNSTHSSSHQSVPLNLIHGLSPVTVMALNQPVEPSSVQPGVVESSAGAELSGDSLPNIVPSSLKKTFTATFSLGGKAFVELGGDFQENPKCLRGLLHNVYKYLKRIDKETSASFKVADPTQSKQFGLMCLSPSLKPYHGFVEAPFRDKGTRQNPSRESKPRFSQEDNSIDSDEEFDRDADTETFSFANEPCVKRAKQEPSTSNGRNYSFLEPDVLLSEENLVTDQHGEDVYDNLNLVKVDQTDSFKIGIEAQVFSKETFEGDLSFAENEGLSYDSDGSSEEDTLDDEIPKPVVGDDIDQYFKSLSDQQKTAVELKRAKRRERDRLRPLRSQDKAPNTELTAKRLAIIQHFFPTQEIDESEKEKLSAMFNRNRLSEISEYTSAIVDHPNFTFVCRCGETFKGKEMYKLHYLQCSGEPLLFYCLLCEQIRDEKELAGHLRSHFYEDGCLICDFTSIKAYMQHRDTHLPPDKFTADIVQHEKARWTCRVCEHQHKLFKKDKDHFRRHLIWSHANPGQCEMCGMSFISHSKLRFHKKSAHYTAKNCKTCGEFMPTFSQSRRHSCDSGRRVCMVCGKDVSRHQINRHMKEVHGESAERTYKCEFCEATFSRLFPMKQHMNIHRGDKPYICLICNKSHTSLAALGGHTRSRHDMTAKEMREFAKKMSVVEVEADSEDQEGEDADIYRIVI